MQFTKKPKYKGMKKSRADYLLSVNRGKLRCQNTKNKRWKFTQRGRDQVTRGVLCHLRRLQGRLKAREISER